MATLSVIGSSSLIAYAVFQNIQKSPEMRPLFYLSFSDLLLGICWLIEALLYGTSTANKDIICYNLQAVGQIFYISSFLYTVNYIWYLYKELRMKHNQSGQSTFPLVIEYLSSWSSSHHFVKPDTFTIDDTCVLSGKCQ